MTRRARSTRQRTGGHPPHRDYGCTRKRASTLSPLEDTITQRRQEQSSARWQYQRQQYHQQQAKKQHCKDERHHHRHQREGMRWKEPRWVSNGRTCGCKTGRSRRRGGDRHGWRGNRGAPDNPSFLFVVPALHAEQAPADPHGRMAELPGATRIATVSIDYIFMGSLGLSVFHRPRHSSRIRYPSLWSVRPTEEFYPREDGNQPREYHAVHEEKLSAVGCGRMWKVKK